MPFTRYHRIYFVKDSQAYKVFGESVYGKFLEPGKRIPALTEENLMAKIDAPKTDHFNTEISQVLRTALYFKGIKFEDIDILRTYPFLFE